MKIACLGDSITYYGGPTAAYPYAQKLQSLLDAAYPGQHLVANHGKRSDLVTVGFQTRYTANIKGRGYDALCFLGGINDVAGDVTAASIEAGAQTILDDARGWATKIVILGMSPFGTDTTDYTAARETVRTTVNTWYANYAATYPAIVSFINLDTLLGDGGSPPALQTIYANPTDHLHWLTAAVDVVAPQVKMALGL